MAPLRLLIVAPWGERAGGAEEMLWTILRHLDRTQIEPEVVFLSPGPFVEEVAGIGIRASSLPATRLRDPLGYARTVMSLARRIRRDRPDAALAWSAKAQVYVGVAAKFARQRSCVLWWQHAIASGHWLERLATVIPADAVGCSSGACEDAQHRLRPHRPTFVVYPGVEPEQPERKVTREELGIDQDAFVVGIVGRLQPWKGQDRVIRAVAELRLGGTPAVALIVGGSAFGLSLGYADDLRDLAHTLGVANRVVFTGQVPDTGPYYPLMDAFVNASSGEPFGIVIVEAMAAGLAVVAFADGGPNEIIEKGESGMLISHDQLAASLASLVADPDLAARLGSNARDRARAAFGAQSSANTFARAITDLCDRRREGRS